MRWIQNCLNFRDRISSFLMMSGQISSRKPISTTLLPTIVQSSDSLVRKVKGFQMCGYLFSTLVSICSLCVHSNCESHTLKTPTHHQQSFTLSFLLTSIWQPWNRPWIWVQKGNNADCLHCQLCNCLNCGCVLSFFEGHKAKLHADIFRIYSNKFHTNLGRY